MLKNATNDNETLQARASTDSTQRKAQLAALHADIADILKRPRQLSEHDRDGQDHSVNSAPYQSFENSHLHELWAARPCDHAAVTALALANAGGQNKPVLWVSERNILREQGQPYGPGLMEMGLNPEKLILISALKNQDSLWALEEGIKSNAFSLVVGELEDISLKNSRRLSLALEEHDTKGILLLRCSYEPQTAAFSRRRAEPSPSAPHPQVRSAITESSLHIDMTKHRGGVKPHRFSMEWNHETDRFHLVSALGDRLVAKAESALPPKQKHRIAR